MIEINKYYLVLLVGCYTNVINCMQNEKCSNTLNATSTIIAVHIRCTSPVKLKNPEELVKGLVNDDTKSRTNNTRHVRKVSWDDAALSTLGYNLAAMQASDK